MENTTSKPHIFSSDQPIRSSSDDLLKRSFFSEQLGKSLSNWNESESLVVGLYGKWGDGKTSVKNMLVENLKTSSERNIDFFEFNPWQWSHKESLMESFFAELIGTISKDEDKGSQKLISKLSDYLEYLKLADELVTKTRNNLQAILIVLAFSLALLSINIGGYLSYIGAITAIVLFGLSQSLKFLNWALSFYIRWRKIGIKSKSLAEKKVEISELLKMYTKTLLVIVDDVDRLNPDEVKALFTLIKANADFPNLVFLLMFQRDIVEKSLEISGVYSGPEYLEKIIQVAIDLPDVPPDGIHQIFFQKLDKSLDEYGGNKHFEQGRWAELFLEGISGYFKNLRDVNRFTSSLSFQMGALCKNGVLEVNAIDLIGIEVLRHFEPAVYKALFENKKILTQSASSGSGRYSEERDKELINSIINKSTQETRDLVQKIIKTLFPNVQWAWSNYYASVDDRDFRKLRVCHPDRFNRYFSFFMTDQEFNQFEFEEVLDVTNDSEKLTKTLLKFHEENRLESFLEKFESYKQEVPAEHSTSFLSSMFEIGEYVTDEHKGFFHFSTLISLERIILWYLKKKEFEKNRSEIYKKAIDATKGVSLALINLESEYSQRQVDKYPDSYSLKEEDKEWIKEKILEIIHKNKDSNIFRKSIHLPRLIRIWKDFEPDSIYDWLIELTKDDDAFLDFTLKIMSKSYVSSGYETKTNHYIVAYYLREFFKEPLQILNRLRLLEETHNEKKYENLFKSIDRAEDEIKNPDKYNDRRINFDDED